VAAVAALVALVETAAGVAERERQSALATRYQDAATQLGSDKAAIRLAGVYAMARLADDWEEEAQTCVDVLCAYLRMSPRPVVDITRRHEHQVRKAIGSVLGQHLINFTSVSSASN
jgi:hypothetical protein